jgi:hypothetical protein
MVNRVERPNTRHAPAVAVECGTPLVCRHPELRLQLSLNIKPKVDYRLYVHHGFTSRTILKRLRDTRMQRRERAHKGDAAKTRLPAASAIWNTRNFYYISNL